MAKARNTTDVRTRAVKAWFAATGIAKDDPHLQLTVYKSRKKDTISVVDNYNPVTRLVWSYKGGSLRRISA